MEGNGGNVEELRLGDLSADFNGASLDDVDARGLRFDPVFGGVDVSNEPIRTGRRAGDPLLVSAVSAGYWKLVILGDADCVSP